MFIMMPAVVKSMYTGVSYNADSRQIHRDLSTPVDIDYVGEVVRLEHSDGRVIRFLPKYTKLVEDGDVWRCFKPIKYYDNVILPSCSHETSKYIKYSEWVSTVEPFEGKLIIPSRSNHAGGVLTDAGIVFLTIPCNYNNPIYKDTMLMFHDHQQAEGFSAGTLEHIYNRYKNSGLPVHCFIDRQWVEVVPVPVISSIKVKIRTYAGCVTVGDSFELTCKDLHTEKELRMRAIELTEFDRLALPIRRDDRVEWLPIQEVQTHPYATVCYSLAGIDPVYLNDYFTI